MVDCVFGHYFYLRFIFTQTRRRAVYAKSDKIAVTPNSLKNILSQPVLQIYRGIFIPLAKIFMPELPFSFLLVV
jgi:hypothetical protein